VQELRQQGRDEIVQSSPLVTTALPRRVPRGYHACTVLPGPRNGLMPGIRARRALTARTFHAAKCTRHL
jgi:hypothetical protein